MRKLVIAAVLCMSVSAAASGGDLVLWLELDETAGPTAPDSSGNGNDGTLSGAPIWRDAGGVIGGALELDGLADHVNCGNDPRLAPADAITVAAWVNHTGGSGNGGIVCHGGGWAYDGFIIWHCNGNIRVELQDTTRGEKTTVDNAPPPSDSWHHVAFTWETNTDTITVYMDGVQAADTGTFAGPIGGAAVNLAVGYVPAQGQFLQGLVDDVRLYDRALGEAEIRALIPPLPPYARDDSAWTVADTPVDIDVLANDADPNAGDTLTVESFQSPTAATGTVADLGGGILRYTPPGSFTGTDTFTYAITDWNGGFDTATVTVTVGPAGEIGLVAHWPLDDSGGSVAPDVSGNGLDGNLFGGAVWAPGIIGEAVQLDGINGHVDLPDGFDDFTQGLTFTLWARPTAVNWWARFITFGTVPGSDMDNIVLSRFDTSKELLFRVFVGGSQSCWVGAPVIVPDRWQFYAATVDSSGNVVLYKDGVEVKRSTTALPNNVIRTVNYIGRSSWAVDEYYEGLIDDARVFNRALAATEIEAMMVQLPPEARDDLTWTEADTSVDIDVLANDADPNAEDTVSIDSVDATLTAGSVTDLGGGILRYAPPAAWSGVDGFSYTVTDGNGGFDTASVTVTVGPAGEVGLVAHWKLDETGGTTAPDSAGTNDGALTNMAGTEWTSGLIGGALQFDGTDDYLDMGNVCNVTKDFTISAWIRPDKLWDATIVTKVTDANDKQYALSLAGGLFFDYERSGSNWSLWGGPVSTGVWQHVAVTVGDSLDVRLYVDGTEVASDTAPVETSVRASGLNIGRYGGTYNNGYFDGLIDDVRVFKRALTAAEIEAMMPELPPAVTPFAGGCSGGRSKASGWALALAALGILAFFHRSLRRKERNMVRRATLLVMAVTLPVLVFSAAAGAEGAPAEETPATSPAVDETKPAAAPAPTDPAVPVPQPLPADPAAPVAPAVPAAPTTGPEIAPVPEVFAEPRARRFGVRAGMFVPAASADETYAESFTAGAFYAGELSGGLGLVKLPFEIGFDFSRSDSDDGRVNADFYTLRCDLLFLKGEGFYFLGGYQLVLASLVIDGAAVDPEYVSAFNVGFGVGSSESPWDARVAYSILAGSENTRGMIAATAGLRF